MIFFITYIIVSLVILLNKRITKKTKIILFISFLVIFLVIMFFVFFLSFDADLEERILTTHKGKSH